MKSKTPANIVCTRPLGKHQGRDGGTAASRRAHALRAVRQFVWLEDDSDKMALPRPTSTLTGHNASRWALAKDNEMNLNAENKFPTPFAEVNDVLQALFQDVQQILSFHLVGMYLEGSLANGDFDEDSDIDFVVITDEDVSENIFSALYVLHERLNLLDTYWSTNLEGSYISQYALRRYDSNHANHPNIERGFGERLKMVYHDETWNIHRYILRERGIVVTGPTPKTLIDPISSNELRQAMLPALHGWATHILNNPSEIVNQGYQSYTVLSLCRILYTLEFADIVSKHKAAKWVKETQGEKWSALIDQAWIGRHNPQLPASTEDISQTLDLIRYALDKPSTAL